MAELEDDRRLPLACPQAVVIAYARFRRFATQILALASQGPEKGPELRELERA
jgi:hypothetical protein